MRHKTHFTFALMYSRPLRLGKGTRRNFHRSPTSQKTSTYSTSRLWKPILTYGMFKPCEHKTPNLILIVPPLQITNNTGKNKEESRKPNEEATVVGGKAKKREEYFRVLGYNDGTLHLCSQKGSPNKRTTGHVASRWLTKVQANRWTRDTLGTMHTISHDKKG